MPDLSSHLPGLLKVSWETSALILLVLVGQRVCGLRLAPRWRHALWWIVLLRLAIPWNLPSPVSCYNFWKPPALFEPAIPLEAPDLATPETESLKAPDATFPPALEPASRPVPRLMQWLFGVWAAGVLILFIGTAADVVKLRRHVARRRPVTDGPTLSLLEDCKAMMGVRTPVTLVETDRVNSPALFGFIRPRVLLPAGLLANFNRAELQHIFLHEMAHVKRLDILGGWLALGFQILHWFNPLIWLAFHRMRADRELACDALVLSRVPPGANESYGLTIVKLLKGSCQPAWGPGLAGILEDNQQMKERIIMIAQFHKQKDSLVLAGVLLAGLALTTLTDAQTSGSDPAPKPGGPPNLIASTPAAGATDVDPGLKEITVTFDQPMGPGFSWTGGGPECPRGTGKPVWRTGTTCVLPVNLEAAHLYRVGINSPSYQNFRSKSGKPVAPTSFYFTTQGASEELQKQMARETAREQNRRAHAQSLAALDAEKGVWVVIFEPTNGFAPQTPAELLQRANQSGAYSGQKGEIGYFRTKIQGNRLTGYFLADDPDQLKAALNGVPDLIVTSVKQLTQTQLDNYVRLPQESVVASDDASHHHDAPDAAKGVWAVHFEPVGDFNPQSIHALLERANESGAHSGRKGEIGYFRTKRVDGKLNGAFLAYDADQLKAALDSVPGLKVTSIDKLNSEELAAYEASPQEE